MKILDYLAVKQFHAKKLAEDAAGDGRVESAFWHTMKMVYMKGVADGEQVARPGPKLARAGTVGITK